MLIEEIALNWASLNHPKIVHNMMYPSFLNIQDSSSKQSLLLNSFFNLMLCYIPLFKLPHTFYIVLHGTHSLPPKILVPISKEYGKIQNANRDISKLSQVFKILKKLWYFEKTMLKTSRQTILIFLDFQKTMSRTLRHHGNG